MKRKIILVITGIILGFLVFMQSKLFQRVQVIYTRDTRANIFHEIQVLKRINDNLEAEVETLQGQLAKTSNQQEALNLIQSEIEKNQLLTGYVNVKGPGIEITIPRKIAIIWFTDLINELWSAGAEAISVNNIRLVNSTVGFDTLPNGQISLDSKPLKAPYVFKVIGNKKVLIEALYQKGGILDQLNSALPDLRVEVQTKDLIEIVKVQELKDLIEAEK